MTKRKSALIAFVVLAIAFGVVFSFDYTDTYVSDRFHKALKKHDYVWGENFSLDAFLEYYDWDRVCVVLPGDETDFADIIGRSYVPRPAKDKAFWSLILLKDGHVNAEIAVNRSHLEKPTDLTVTCFDRWSAIISFEENTSGGDAEDRLAFANN